MTEPRLSAGLGAAALFLSVGALTGCTATPSCGDLAVDVTACGATETAPGDALPPFSDGVGMSEWLMYRGNDVRALSYSPSASAVSGGKDTRIDALEVEECAPLEHSATLSHRGWTVTDASGDRVGNHAGKLVNGRLTEDPPITLAAGDCTKTVLALAVSTDAKPATVQDGPEATWVLPSD